MRAASGIAARMFTMALLSCVASGCTSGSLHRYVDREMGVLCYLYGANGIHCLPVHLLDLPLQQEANVQERGSSEHDARPEATRSGDPSGR